MPSFVSASWFLNTNRDHEELYHEEYDTVAVMFASLTEYALWDDNTVDGANELSSIRLLNQIICDFDKVNSGHLFIYLTYQWIHYRPVTPSGYGIFQKVQKHTDYYDTYIRQQKHIHII